jgi:choline dehydrogenase
MASTFDYVIVGAGTAGCVLANRLSEAPSATVLLLEAGGSDRHPNVRIPAAFAKQFRTRLDWDFATEPEPGCADRSLYIPRGKSLGGSSSMNAMLYARGRPLDYDAWESSGCEGWGWSDVLPYFKGAEDSFLGATEAHGTGGPVRVERLRSPRPLTRRIIESAQEAGIPFNPDYNTPEQDGVSPVQVFQRRGRRWSGADAYLRPVMKRPNLTLSARAHALALESSDGAVTGVRYRDRRGRVQAARATRETILAAGSIGSPQLLMLSGYGPAEHLSELGIEVVEDLPGVGANLQDHPYCVCIWESRVPESLADAERPKALAEFLLRRTGPLTSSVAEALAFVRSRPGLPAPDLEFHCGPAYFNDNGFDEYDGHAFTLAPVLLTPRSRGTIRLRSSDPLAKPAIRGNHLTEPDDVAALVAGVELARRIAGTGPLAEAAGREIFPGEAVEGADALEDDVRRRAELLYHPAGTCRMGADDEAVVDPELRVRGTRGLRVVDASIMPLIPGGNTNAPTIMIAEKAADLILGRQPPQSQAAPV